MAQRLVGILDGDWEPADSGEFVPIFGSPRAAWLNAEAGKVLAADDPFEAADAWLADQPTVPARVKRARVAVTMYDGDGKS